MNIKILAPKTTVLSDNFFSQNVLPVFDPIVVNFIDHFSRILLKNTVARGFPEIVAMAFWMRKAHLSKLAQNYHKELGDSIRQGRGIVFHIAPSNVDSIFIYSWFISMLAGNINVVRISSHRNEQINLLLELLNQVLELPEYHSVMSKQIIVTYEHDDTITEFLSSHCDMRVIWGGDKTIQKIRQIPLPATAIELPFTDKFSLALINSISYIEASAQEQKDLVNNFINDAYWFGQMACSSPRLLVWIGDSDDVKRAENHFWVQVNKKLDAHFADISAADIVNKLVTSHSLAIESEVSIIPSENNLLNRIWLSQLDDIKPQLHCGAGLFYEYAIQQLKELIPLFSRKIQTVGVYGISSQDLKNFVIQHHPKGIDRFVSIGKALEFSPVWDGYNLLNEFTRIIDINL